MKQYITIILIAAMAAACSKSNVTYEQPETIALMPVSSNMTKAAVGVTPSGQELLIYANYTEGQIPGSAYLDAALFYEKEKDSGIWMGKNEDYFWPKSGKITLSGCTALPSGFGTVNYSYRDNTFSVPDYKQSLSTANTVDFIWFNQTDPVNYDGATDNLAVVMNHALTWVTIQVKGFGGSEGWKVESIKLLGVQDTGSLTCKKNTSGESVAEWQNVGKTDNTEGATDITVFQATTTGSTTNYFTLTDTAQDIENYQDGTVLIPQTPLQMEVKYHTTDSPSDGSYGNSPSTLRSKILDLRISETPADNFWQAGKHYVYTVTFNPYKITFTVNNSTWGEENKEIKDYIDSEINP